MLTTILASQFAQPVFMQAMAMMAIGGVAGGIVG